MKILLATTNKGKINEFRRLLETSTIEVLSLHSFPELPEIEENGRTFAENAFIKARTAAQLTNLLTIADDSGLEVEALKGAPGIYSARYAGEPKDDGRNIEKLLAELEEINPSESFSPEKRRARFRCCLAIVDPEGEEHLVEGTVEGYILTKPRGTGGFGYDPVFYVPEFNKTMAELTMAEKNSISHRAQAFQKAVPIIKNILKQ
ncbi:MAG: XTP/dITP diphosphatase [Desulfitobacteriia bacterium]